MATVTEENLKKDKEKQNRGLIKHQKKFKKGEQQRNKARARVRETPEQTHERREANLRNKARARIHETSEQAHERREANLRNVTKHRANQTSAKFHEMIHANSRNEENVEVTDSKAKAFHHILKTRICHDEQLSHEILDFIQNQG